MKRGRNRPGKRGRQKEIKSNIKGKNKGGQYGNNKPGQDRIRSLGEPLTPKKAHGLAKRQTRAEYAPTMRANKAEIQASRNRQGEVGDWFNQLGGQIAQTAAATDASYGAANAAMQANIEAGARAAQQNQQNVASQDASFAALTGADPSSFSATAQQMNAGAAQRDIAGAALAAPIAAAGASQAAYLRNTGITAGRESINQRQKEMKRRLKLKQDRTDLRQERGGKVADRFIGLREGEADRSLERWKVNKAFAGDQSAAAAAAKEAARDRRQRERENEEDNDTSRANNAEDNANEGGSGDRAENREAWKNGVATLKRLTSAYGAPKNKAAWEELEDQVESTEGVSPVQARKIVARYRRSVKKKRGQGDGYNPPGGWAK